jgi:hypothetical protein
MTDPQSRIEDLEYRLARYHEWLERSIQDRDRLALDAAWGVTGTLNSLLAFGGVLATGLLYFKADGWWQETLVWLAAWIVSMGVWIWTNEQRMKEVDRLAKLPTWEWKID